ncbi:MAG: polysaccharide pyruvyl transferase family protein [Leptolyngbya sp. SIO4C1]|nr:polysaccharide pyruvyl transferase family protein [Leptolyngbya sp. SIO4C1]
MKLYYYQRRDRSANFGDELNPWLWPRLLPGCFDEDDATLFVGTGTLLNHLLPVRTASARRLIIFSTGAGYEKPLRQIPSHWQIICVRGPLSANRLGLPASSAIADGGLLIHRCFSPTGKKTARYGLMPHVHHATYAQATWQQICQQLDIRYIDPRWPVEQVLTAISETELLLAEAMHGAIAADALRVPWIPILTSPRMLRFKWQDWCASMRLPYRPQVLAPLADYPRYGRGLRSGLCSAAHWSRYLKQTALSYPPSLQTSARLAQILSRPTPYLSQNSWLANRVEQLEAALWTVRSRDAE